MTSLYDTGIYILPSDVNLDKLFGGRGKSFLKSEPNARLYGMFDGNETLKSRDPIKPSKCYEMPVIKYQNNAVYSDFPRGAGMLDTTFMWADATYDQMRQAVERQNAEVPEFIALKPPLRKRIFDLGAVTGGTQKLVREGIQRYKTAVQKEKDEKHINYLRDKGINEEKIDQILKVQQAGDQANALSTSAAGITNTAAKQLLTEALLQRNLEEEPDLDDEERRQRDFEGLEAGFDMYEMGTASSMGTPIGSLAVSSMGSLALSSQSGTTISELSSLSGHRRRDLPPNGALNTAQQVMLPRDAPHRMPEAVPARPFVPVRPLPTPARGRGRPPGSRGGRGGGRGGRGGGGSAAGPASYTPDATDRTHMERFSRM